MTWVSAWRFVRVAAAGVCVIASVATSAVRAQETFVIAISPGVDMAFGRELRLTIDEMEKLTDGRYRRYKENVDLHSVLYDSFPTNKFDVLITSDSELLLRPDATLHVENGRRVKSAFSFVLLSTQRKAMDRFKSSTVVHPKFESFNAFFSEVLDGCIFKGWSAEHRPLAISKETEIFARNPSKIDILVLNAMRGYDRVIGGSLLAKLISNRWSRPQIIPYYESPDVNATQIFRDCLASTRGGTYRFANRSDVKFSRLLPVVRSESTSIQIVEKDETIKIVVPKSVWIDKKFKEHFFKDLYAGLNYRKEIAQLFPFDVVKQKKLEKYVHGYELLTYTLVGVLEVANIRFREAADSWSVLETLQPIQRIAVQLGDRKPLMPAVIAAIDDVISAYGGAFEKLEQLPREKITLTSLRARVRLTQLHFFKHQHALLTNNRETSCRELDMAHQFFEALRKEIDIVKTVDDFNYNDLRDNDYFAVLEDHYLGRRLRPIVRVPRCNVS